MPKRRSPVRRKAAVAKAPSGRSAVGEKEAPEASTESWEKIFTEEISADKSRSNVSLSWQEVQCPYCGEDFEIRVDPSEEGHSMVQDCQVCCKSIMLAVDVEDGEVMVTAARA